MLLNSTAIESSHPGTKREPPLPGLSDHNEQTISSRQCEAVLPTSKR